MADHREVEEKRREYIFNEVRENPAWQHLLHKVEFDGKPALVMMGYDHDCILVTFSRITDGQAIKLIQKANG